MTIKTDIAIAFADASSGLQLCALYCLSACSAPALEQLRDAWDAPISTECWDTVLATEVVTLSSAELQRVCNTSTVKGCGYTDTGVVYRESGTSEYVEAHELLHVLLRCETGDSDRGHTASVWSRL